MDWTKAEERLTDLTEQYLDAGSINIQPFLERIYPLRNRLKSGERTHELYDAIMSAKGPI